MFTLLVSIVALAADPVLAPESARAEYNRLAEQMTRLAERNAWTGVERAWSDLSKLGLEVQVEHVMLAAQAARTTGDAMAVRERLLVAMRLDPNMDTARWLGEMQSQYGAVVLVAGKARDVTLAPDARPFQPDRATAIDYASTQLTSNGRFEGLLPSGAYTFGDRAFEVAPGTDPVQIALK